MANLPEWKSCLFFFFKLINDGWWMGSCRGGDDQGSSVRDLWSSARFDAQRQALKSGYFSALDGWCVSGCLGYLHREWLWITFGAFWLTRAEKLLSNCAHLPFCIEFLVIFYRYFIWLQIIYILCIHRSQGAYDLRFLFAHAFIHLLGPTLTGANYPATCL